MMKNCGGAFSAYLKTPPQPFAITQASYITALSLAKHIYSAPLCKGELLLLSQARRLLRDCCRHPLHFHHHPHPLSALKFKIRAAGATTILHSSLFIIHYSSSLISSACGNTTIPLSLSSSPSCGIFPSHSYPHLFLSQNI